MSGVVPDAAPAMKIAEAVWIPIYGEDVVDKEPYIAEYDSIKGMWTVTGSLPKDVDGGVRLIIIRKSDGKIMKIHHGM